jgi:hypothetical protein
MKFKNRIFALLFIFGCSSTVFSQNNLLIGSGHNLANFNFIDSSDVKDDGYAAKYSTSFNLGYAYNLENGMYFQTKIGVRNAGSNYVYDDFNYHWNINYAEYRLGLGYRYNFGSVDVHFATEGYVSYALSAEQRLHNVYRDMIKTQTIERLDYGLFLSPGVGYELTKKISLEIDLNYMLGLGNLDKNEGQTAQNRLLGVNLGLNIKL